MKMNYYFKLFLTKRVCAPYFPHEQCQGQGYLLDHSCYHYVWLPCVILVASYMWFNKSCFCENYQSHVHML